MDIKVYLKALERELSFWDAEHKEDRAAIEEQISLARKALGVTEKSPADKPKAPAKKVAARSKKSE